MKKLFLFIIGVSLSLVSYGKSSQQECVKSIDIQAKTDTVTKAENIKMLLDLDTGVDDAMALAYALGQPNVDVIGVTTVFGNVTEETSVNNTLNLLSLLGHPEIPVFSGADKPFAETTAYTPRQILLDIHGNNGVGDVDLPKSTRLVEKQSVVDFMIEAANKYGKDLYIVATGPETNLAEVLKKDPKFGEKVGKIVIMGGALIVEGNTTPFSEANIYNDPIAASDFFLSSTPFTMVGLDVTHKTLLTKGETKKWRDLGTTSGMAFADIVDHYIEWETAHLPELKGCALHDPLAVAVAIHPEYVKTLELPMKVITEGTDKGRTISITGKLNDAQARNVNVAVDVEVDVFVTDFNKTLTDLFTKN